MTALGGGSMTMKGRILGMASRFLRSIGDFSGHSFRYSSDLQSSKSCTRKVSLGLLSSQVSDQSKVVEDLVWIVATVSRQLETVQAELQDLLDRIDR